MLPDPTPVIALDPLWAALDLRLQKAASEMRLALTPAQCLSLLAYGALIQRWTQVYNLTALRDTESIFTHHLLDCLAVVAPMTTRCAPLPNATGRQVLDVGSGAGLPGVVLAVMLPEWQVTCVDSVAKKTTFIRQVAAELRLRNFHAVHGRVEAPSTFVARRGFDLITSRAFASLRDFTELTRAVRAPSGEWVAMKAHLTADERAEVPNDLDMFHVEQIKVPSLDAARCLVWLRPKAESP